MMTTAMLAAIAADLDDDTRRLAYADWLDEHDDHDRAELIRVQCRLLGLDSHDHSALFAAMRRPGGQRMPHCQLCDEWLDAKGRERELIAAHPEWTRWPCLKRVVCPDCINWKGRVPRDCRCIGSRRLNCLACGGTGDLLKNRPITWDRGWPGWVHVERVSELVVTEVQRTQYETGPFHTDEHTRPTPLLTALAITPPWGVPLRGVIADELRPSNENSGSWWFRGENLESSVFDCLPDKPNIRSQNGARYPTKQAAIRAAAAAFLEFGRKHK